MDTTIPLSDRAQKIPGLFENVSYFKAVQSAASRPWCEPRVDYRVCSRLRCFPAQTRARDHLPDLDHMPQNPGHVSELYLSQWGKCSSLEALHLDPIQTIFVLPLLLET